MKVRQKYITILTLALPLILIGCQQQEKEDLIAYIKSTETGFNSDISPIPIMAIYEGVPYTGGRNPFLPTEEESDEPLYDNEVAFGSDALRPDIKRRKEALEYYPVGELKLVGMLAREKAWALIKAPDGIIHRVTVGSYLGKDHGKILTVNEDKIVFKEIVQDARGAYMERDSFMLTEIGNNN